MLHGIDTVREHAKQPLQDSQTDIICVLGTVPTFLLNDNLKTLNTPVPIRNYQDVSKYAGQNLPDFTMYDALETILTESGGAKIYMINVFDETLHKTSVEDEVYTPVASKFTINHPGVKNLVITVDETVAQTNDYRIINNAENMTIELISEEFKTAESVTCTYDYADVTKVNSSDFVGTIDSDGNKTGSKAISTVTQIFGDDVNIIIAPVYSAQQDVRNALISVAEDLKARAYVDCPKGMSINNAIAERLNGGTLSCDSPNVYMAMPYVYRYNQFKDENILSPLSPVLAGLRVKLNRTQDVAKSIDNTRAITIVGLEYPVEFILNKENTEANSLNASGIATVINWKGSYRIWGARNCAYPSNTGIETFDSVIDTANFIEKTIESGSFECVGAKITRAFIDNILETIKAKFNSWKNPEVALILDGNVWYDENLNPAEEVANGHIIFSYDFCPPGVAEHIRYNSYINIKYISTSLVNI